MFDLIGDIHGYADELVRMLGTLGHRRTDGVYRHEERRAICMGDFIDRGPKVAQVLEIVRPMVEQGSAMAVTSNHEWNALAYHTKDPRGSGDHLRSHTPKNEQQHRLWSRPASVRHPYAILFP